MAVQSPKIIITQTARTGYVCDQPGWPAAKQREILLREGVLPGRIWTEGYKGETLEAAVKGARSAPLEMAGGYRVLGINPKQIMQKLPLVESVTVMDAETKETRRDFLVTAALHAVRYGRNKIAEEDAARGRATRANRLKERRCPEPQAKAMWLDLKIKTNAEASRLINNGYEVPWTTQTLARHFGKSGRPIGRRPTKNTPPPEKYPGPGYVYFIQGGRNRVKIGYSLNHVNRLASIKTNHFAELKLLGTIRGTRDDEKKLHMRFWKYHVRGEWFRIDGALAKFLRSKAITRPKKD